MDVICIKKEEIFRMQINFLQWEKMKVSHYL